MAIALLDATRDKKNNSAMILDRIILCDQTSQRLEKYSIPHGVLQAGHWRFRPYENIQICSAQTLEKRGDFPDLKLLVVDECFPAGTMISTPTGDKDISIVRCGDTVYNASGVGIVMGTMARPADELVKLEFEDGRTIECTGNHPIFTDRGWVKASEMEVGRVSYSIQGLRLLWENFCANYENRLRQGGGVEQLQKLGESEDLLQILLQEAEKSDERSIVSRQDEGILKENKASADSTRREWQIASSAADCFASRFGYWMGVGVSDSNKDEAFKDWISNLLQAGHCQRGDENWDRVGRWFSLLSGAKSARFQEDRISCFPRLDCISVVKRESVIPVFNLHISGHPSYFANGKLVHNCHTTRAQTVEFIKNNPDVRVIGLTATPFTKGLGKIYDGVISTITTKELVDQKVLVPLRVFIAKEIDMTGAKKVAGEWSQKETTTRGMKITGDIVAEWVKKTHEIFGRPRKTIVFCSGVNHGADLAKKFADAGYNFVSISYKDDDQFKADVIEDFAKPDTEINGLIATDILTKGFDVSDVMIGISARPFSKSLSSHIQQMGRVMRGMPHAPEEKPFAVWLDHSGNYLRFQEDWDDVYNNGVHELDEGREKAKKEKTDKEKKESCCPRCAHVWQNYSDVCLSCGYVRERKNQVEAVAGELHELKTANKLDNKQDYWSMCQFKIQYGGWNEKRALAAYKNKFGVWPKGLHKVPITPSPQFERDAKASLIRYLKGKAKA
jgi:superfamily II DNA or RNA helicase